MSRLEKKDIYTYEDLTTHKLSEKERDEKLIKSLIKIMFESIGQMDKGFEWAKAHDKHEQGLPWYMLFVSTMAQYDAFRDQIKRIVKKQFGYGLNSRQNDWETGMFMLSYSFCTEDNQYKTDWNKLLKERIAKYEEQYGELKYDDGFEVELKERIGYNKE